MKNHHKVLTFACVSLLTSTIFLNHTSAKITKSSPNNSVTIAQSSTSKSTTIIPGKSVGAISKKTKRTDLVKMFGASKLKDEKTLFFGGDAEFPGTRVKLGKDEYSLVVLWKDEKRTQALGVMVYDPKWKTAEGIGVGTTLNTLRQKAGEFQFSGFGWDYGGLVQLRNTKLSKYEDITIQMDTDKNSSQKYPNDSQYASGEKQLSSQDPRLKRLNISVSRMIVMFK
jgi:hypothetical protein